MKEGIIHFDKFSDIPDLIIERRRIGVVPTLLTNDTTNIERRVRLVAFNWLGEQVYIHGDGLPQSIFARGFEPESGYDDNFGPEGLLFPVAGEPILSSATTRAFEWPCSGRCRSYISNVDQKGMSI